MQLLLLLLDFQFSIYYIVLCFSVQSIISIERSFYVIGLGHWGPTSVVKLVVTEDFHE